MSALEQTGGPVRNATVAVVLLVVSFVLPARSADAPDPLRHLAILADRTWIAEGKWSDGSPMKVEQRFFWGPTRRILHFESYDLTGKERQLLYEGIIFFDAERGRVLQWNFKTSGERNEYEYTTIDDKGFEARGANTRSIVKFENRDLLRWELRLAKGEKWATVLEATYRPAPAQP